jgi:hypothetical protein
VDNRHQVSREYARIGALVEIPLCLSALKAFAQLFLTGSASLD